MQNQISEDKALACLANRRLYLQTQTVLQPPPRGRLTLTSIGLKCLGEKTGRTWRLDPFPPRSPYTGKRKHDMLCGCAVIVDTTKTARETAEERFLFFSREFHTHVY